MPFSRWTTGPIRAFVLLALILGAAQAQQPTGTMVCRVTDPTGAVIQTAEVVVQSEESGFRARAVGSGAGSYTVAGLLPGRYRVQVQAAGFRAATVLARVAVGEATVANVVLEVGTAADAITVRADAVQVNTRQTALEGVITEELIRELPLNGRNFLELGQLEPSVQVNSGLIGVGGINTTLGVAGQSGMTTRVTLDGLDITDDHFGAAAENISQEAIQEFQVTRSAADISTGLSGNGAVNIITKSGGNEVHGTAFAYWRDDALAASIAPEPVPFQRGHFGFSAGGPFLNERLFWFVNYERIDQKTGVATVVPEFPQFSGTWQVPYDERLALGRSDWVISTGVRAFARFTHNAREGIPAGSSFGGNNLVPRSTVDFSNGTAAGLDLSRGRYTHSIRFGYLNVNTRNVAGITLIPGLQPTLDPGGRPLTVNIGSVLSIGVNGNSPQHRYQDTYESRYDGGAVLGNHSVRWGALVNFIRTNWFEALRSTPVLTLDFSAALRQKCGSDPMCYPVRGGVVGNDIGWLSELPTLGFPYGGFKNNRVHAYVGDTWRANSRLHISFGMRWAYEPGQNTPDLVKPAFLEQFEAGLSRPDRPDTNNLAPQLGLAWDPTGRGKWVIRANAGLYYDTYLLRNAWWVRNNLSTQPIRGVSGNFSNGLVDPNTGQVIFDFDEWAVSAGCGTQCTLSTPGLLDAIFAATAQWQDAYRLFSLSGTEQPSQCETLAGACQVMDPDYATPYTLQFSAGVQRELLPGLVLSVDYVRHRGQHYVERTDANRLGAADTFDLDRALAAMIATHRALGCGASYSSAAIECAIGKGATIYDYGSRGMGGAGGAGNRNARVFYGLNPDFNRVIVYRMTGWSTYNALQAQVRGRLPNAGGVLRNWSILGSYALGRLVGTSQEQNMVWLLEDDFKSMSGPTTLDRSHIFSLASGFDTVWGFRLSSFWRASSPLAQSVFLNPGRTTNPAEIFVTDLDGDGSSGDPLPGTNRGSYGRDIGCGAADLNRAIDGYNSTTAGGLTPAGKVLVGAGLFTTAQLSALGAVAPAVTRAPEGQVCLDSLMMTDVRISRPIRFGNDRITIEPALEVFNVFNVANFDLPNSKLGPVLDGLPGSVNGTTRELRTNRAGVTGGTMSVGAPRSWQLAVRLTF